MEALFTSLLVLLGGTIVYLLLNLKITRTVDVRFKEFHKNTIHKDTAEFYREMESYAALMENKINRFNALLARQEDNVRKWENIFNEIKSTRRGKDIDKYLNESALHEKNIARVLEQNIGKFAMPAKVPEKIAAEKKPSLAQAELAKPIKKNTRKAKEKEPEKKAQQPTKQSANLTNRVQAIHQKVNTFKQARPENLYHQMAEETANLTDTHLHDEDVAELVRGMQDHVDLSLHKPKSVEKAEKAIEKVKADNRDAGGLLQVFSRIGKALQPTLLGEEPAPQKKSIPPAKSFTESLEAAQRSTPMQAKVEYNYLQPDTYTPSVGAQSMRQNSLAEKKLDPEQLNFLIHSLKIKESQKAALRTLIERNVPLKMISELSQIPESELELTIRVHKF